jgi:subtilisin
LQPEHPEARRSVEIEADEEEIRRKRDRFHEDVIIEPKSGVKYHAPAINAEVSGAKKPLFGAQVSIVFTENGKLKQGERFRTNKKGRARVEFDSEVPQFVLAEPAGRFWAVFTNRPAPDVHFDCPALPGNGPLEWWHKVIGIDAFDKDRGKGIRIGVVGSGVGPHACLKHVRRVDRKFDVLGHETHVCGIMAARPRRKGQYGGIAPGASFFSMRISERDRKGVVRDLDQGVIAHCIETLSERFDADLINLSFGIDPPGEIVLDGIRCALDHGTLCVASAGNDFGGPVHMPAAFPEVVAVSALGLLKWAPAGTVSSFYVPPNGGGIGKDNLFFPIFSNKGSKVECTAPGTGIVSTVPEWFGLKEPYAVMDGTSLASPAVCGLLAALLAKSPAYLQLPRAAERAEAARSILKANCHSVGLQADMQGSGKPELP